MSDMEFEAYIGLSIIAIVILSYLGFSSLYDIAKANAARLEYICQKLIALEYNIEKLDEDLYEDDEEEEEQEEEEK